MFSHGQRSKCTNLQNSYTKFFCSKFSASVSIHVYILSVLKFHDVCLWETGNISPGFPPAPQIHCFSRQNQYFSTLQSHFRAKSNGFFPLGSHFRLFYITNRQIWNCIYPQWQYLVKMRKIFFIKKGLKSTIFSYAFLKQLKDQRRKIWIYEYLRNNSKHHKKYHHP